jgi:TPP-dependent indolepyruvate ferredoxin oxidoreductase alpha subunit
MDRRMSLPAFRARAAATGRPATDAGCAGCAQLGTLRALRRAGVAIQGGIGCDPAAEAPLVATTGRWAAVTGAGRIRRERAPLLLDAAARAGARLVVIADRVAPVRATALEDSLVQTGWHLVRLDLDDLAGMEARVREALETPRTVLLSLAPCLRGGSRLAPVLVDASRCNRCGACLSLACPAITDGGEEAMRIDGATCTGCGRCEPLCRARALARTG